MKYSEIHNEKGDPLKCTLPNKAIMVEYNIKGHVFVNGLYDSTYTKLGDSFER